MKALRNYLDKIKPNFEEVIKFSFAEVEVLIGTSAFLLF